MVGWHHRLNRHQFEQAPGDGEGQGSLTCFSPWDCKELDMPEQLNNNNKGAEKSNGCLDPQIPSCCRNIPLEGIRKSSSEQRCVMVCTTSPSNLYVEVLTSSITVLCSVTSVLSHPFRPYGLYPPGSSVRGILQARILEWLPFLFSRQSSSLRGQTRVSCISRTAVRFFTTEPLGKANPQYCTGQKVHLEFSLRYYRKIRMNFLTNSNTSE